MLMVEHIENNWHLIYAEQIRWSEIIGIDWNRDKKGYIT